MSALNYANYAHYELAGPALEMLRKDRASVTMEDLEREGFLNSAKVVLHGVAGGPRAATLYPTLRLLTHQDVALERYFLSMPIDYDGRHEPPAHGLLLSEQEFGRLMAPSHANGHGQPWAREIMPPEHTAVPDDFDPSRHHTVSVQSVFPGASFSTCSPSPA